MPSLFVSLLIGYHISLKDPEMALAVESCLKGQLQAFTCDNHEDERVLQGLMTRVLPRGRRPAIITSSFLPLVHDTRKRWGHVQYSPKRLLEACLSSTLHWKFPPLQKTKALASLIHLSVFLFLFFLLWQLYYKEYLFIDINSSPAQVGSSLF